MSYADRGRADALLPSPAPGHQLGQRPTSGGCGLRSLRLLLPDPSVDVTCDGGLLGGRRDQAERDGKGVWPQIAVCMLSSQPPTMQWVGRALGLGPTRWEQ